MLAIQKVCFNYLLFAISVVYLLDLNINIMSYKQSNIRHNRGLLKVISIIAIGAFLFNTLYIDISWADQDILRNIRRIETKNLGVIHTELPVPKNVPIWDITTTSNTFANIAAPTGGAFNGAIIPPMGLLPILPRTSPVSVEAWATEESFNIELPCGLQIESPFPSEEVVRILGDGTTRSIAGELNAIYEHLAGFHVEFVADNPDILHIYFGEGSKFDQSGFISAPKTVAAALGEALSYYDLHEIALPAERFDELKNELDPDIAKAMHMFLSDSKIARLNPTLTVDKTHSAKPYKKVVITLVQPKNPTEYTFMTILVDIGSARAAIATGPLHVPGGYISFNEKTAPEVVKTVLKELNEHTLIDGYLATGWLGSYMYWGFVLDKLPLKDPTDPDNRITDITTLIETYLPPEYHDCFNVPNLPRRSHGEGPLLIDHYIRMLDAFCYLGDYETLDLLPAEYLGPLVDFPYQQFHELFLLLHDIGKTTKEMQELGRRHNNYPGHDDVSVTMLELDPRLAQELPNRDVLIEVIRLHTQLYAMSKKDKISPEAFESFVRGIKLKDKAEEVLLLLITCCFLDAMGCDADERFELRVVKFIKAYEHYQTSRTSPASDNREQETGDDRQDRTSPLKNEADDLKNWLSLNMPHVITADWDTRAFCANFSESFSSVLKDSGLSLDQAKHHIQLMIDKAKSPLASTEQKFREKGLPITVKGFSLRVDPNFPIVALITVHSSHRHLFPSLAATDFDEYGLAYLLEFNLFYLLKNLSSIDEYLTEFTIAHEFGHGILNIAGAITGSYPDFRAFVEGIDAHPYIDKFQFKPSQEFSGVYPEAMLSHALKEVVADWIAIQVLGNSSYVIELERLFHDCLQLYHYPLAKLLAEAGMAVIQAEALQPSNYVDTIWQQIKRTVSLSEALSKDLEILYKSLSFRTSPAQFQPDNRETMAKAAPTGDAGYVRSSPVTNIEHYGFRGKLIATDQETFYEKLGDEVERKDAKIVVVDGLCGTGKTTLVKGNKKYGVSGLKAYLSARFNRPVVIIKGDYFLKARSARVYDAHNPQEITWYDNATLNKSLGGGIRFLIDKANAGKYHRLSGKAYSHITGKQTDELAELVGPIAHNALMIVDGDYLFKRIEPKFLKFLDSIGIWVFVDVLNDENAIVNIIDREKEKDLADQQDFGVLRNRMTEISIPSMRGLQRAEDYMEHMDFVAIQDDFKQPRFYESTGRTSPMAGETLHEQMVKFFESANVNKDGTPIIPDAELDRLAHLLREADERGSNTYFLKKVIPVFCDLYAVPDIRAREIMSHLGIAKSELLRIYKFIRNSDVLQKLFRTHPMHEGFFRGMKRLLSAPEYVQKTFDKKATFLLDLEVHPSAKCDKNCTSCFNREHLYYDEAMKDDETMKAFETLTVDEWVALINNAAANGLEKLFISGGLEPLHDTAIEKTIAIIETARKRNIEIILFTHGNLVDTKNRKLISALLKLDSIFLSLKATTPKTYKKVVGLSGKDFTKGMEAARYLAREAKGSGSSLKVNIAFLINVDNFRELPDMLKFAQDAKVDSIGLGTDFVRGLIGFSEENKRELGQMVRQAKANKEIEVGLDNRLISLSYSFDKETLPPVYQYNLRPVEACPMAHIFPTISPFGRVYDCCHIANPGIAKSFEQLGHITKERSLKDIMTAQQGHVHNRMDCLSCNPWLLSRITAYAKLKDDYEEGISIDMQAFRTSPVQVEDWEVLPEGTGEREAKWQALLNDRWPFSEIETKLGSLHNQEIIYNCLRRSFREHGDNGFSFKVSNANIDAFKTALEEITPDMVGKHGNVLAIPVEALTFHDGAFIYYEPECYEKLVKFIDNMKLTHAMLGKAIVTTWDIAKATIDLIENLYSPGREYIKYFAQTVAIDFVGGLALNIGDINSTEKSMLDKHFEPLSLEEGLKYKKKFLMTLVNPFFRHFPPAMYNLNPANVYRVRFALEDGKEIEQILFANTITPDSRYLFLTEFLLVDGVPFAYGVSEINPGANCIYISFYKYEITEGGYGRRKRGLAKEIHARRIFNIAGLVDELGVYRFIVDVPQFGGIKDDEMFPDSLPHAKKHVAQIMQSGTKPCTVQGLTPDVKARMARNLEAGAPLFYLDQYFVPEDLALRKRAAELMAIKQSGKRPLTIPEIAELTKSPMTLDVEGLAKLKEKYPELATSTATSPLSATAIDQAVQEFLRDVDIENIVIFMDKDMTFTDTGAPITDEMRDILIALARHVKIVVVTGHTAENTIPNVVDPVENQLIALGEKETLANIRYYYFSGAEGHYYDAEGNRQEYLMKDSFTNKERLHITKANALSFLEEVESTFTDQVDLNDTIEQIRSSKSKGQIKKLFSDAISTYGDLLGYVSLTDKSRGLTLELATSHDLRAKTSVANLDFMTRVMSRHHDHITGKIRSDTVIKVGPTFITNMLVDKERVIATIPETLGIKNPSVIGIGDSETDYGFLGHEDPQVRKLSFLVADPESLETPLPPNVLVTETEGPDGTKIIWKSALSAVESDKTSPVTAPLSPFISECVKLWDSFNVSEYQGENEHFIAFGNKADLTNIVFEFTMWVVKSGFRTLECLDLINRAASIINYLAENVAHHASDYGLILIEMKKDGLYIAMMDRGEWGIVDEEGRPVIKIKPDGAFVQREGSTGRARGLKGISEAANNLTILTGGYLWNIKKPDHLIEVKSTKDMKGTLVIAEVNIVRTSPVVMEKMQPAPFAISDVYMRLQSHGESMTDI